jgi:hypothetical protein
LPSWPWKASRSIQDCEAAALALDALYVAIGVVSFLLFFRQARERGLLLQQGE